MKEHKKKEMHKYKINKIHIDRMKNQKKSYVERYYYVLSIHITQELPQYYTVLPTIAP